LLDALKELLRELPEPIFNDRNLYEKLLIIYQTNNKSLLLEIVEFLPTANRVNLLDLVKIEYN